jgi:prepilin-type N-terminal cleavage/methylation domain-containing protein
MRLTPRRHDAGFTLVELLMTVAILAVIMVPLAGVVIGWLNNADATTDRLALSHDAQISAAYFAQDVAAVGTRDYAAVNTPFKQSIQLDAAYNAGGYTCGTATTPAAKVRFLSDVGDNSAPTPTSTTEVIAYYLKAAGPVSELHRMRCSGSSTPVSDVVVAHYVDPATATVTCSSTCTAAPSVPQQVTLAFTVTKPSVGAYPISLNGQRRQT